SPSGSLSFEKIAGRYDETRALPDGPAREVAAAIAAELERRPPGPVLEVGVGTGRISLPLLRLGVRVIGLDLSRAMMERYREKAAPLRPSLLCGDATALPIRDRSVGVVIAALVFHLVPKWRQALS